MHTHKTMSIHTIANIVPYKPLQKSSCLRIILHNITMNFSMYVKHVFHPSNVPHAYKMIIQHINPMFPKSKTMLIILAYNDPHLVSIYFTCKKTIYLLWILHRLDFLL